MVLGCRTRRYLLRGARHRHSELAHVGLTELMTKDRGVTVKVLGWPLADNDRAQAERETGGFVKVLVDGRGRIKGATIVGQHAGELIQPWVLAISSGLEIGAPMFLARSSASFPAASSSPALAPAWVACSTAPRPSPPAACCPPEIVTALVGLAVSALLPVVYRRIKTRRTAEA